MNRYIGLYDCKIIEKHRSSQIVRQHVCGSIIVAAILLRMCASAGHAQSPNGAVPNPQASVPVLKVNSQLVLVDVTVEDSNGNPVHGLTSKDFELEENKAVQRLRNFEEHSATDPSKPGPPMPRLPEGTFTNYTPIPPSGTLNILLVDAMNTPMKDQTYLRSQLQQYVNTATPGQTIAIFGLNSRLYLLQGFTSNLQILKDAIDHKLNARGSDLLDDPMGDNQDHINESDMMSDLGPGNDEIVSSVQQFEADSQSLQLQFRAQYTLDALNSLAHYLQNFSGRKNLIWFSGSFPISILPNPDIGNGFSVMQLNAEEFRETTNLLAKAQVAVYPVDARGLSAPPMFDAAGSGRKYVGSPTAMGKDLSQFDASQAAEHTTMNQMAADTGGHAYFGTNGLAKAVSNAINSGSNYYTLAYSPSDRDEHGEYRSIHVSLTGAVAGRDLRLLYRHGYYVAEPRIYSESIASNSAANTPDPKTVAASAYEREAMSHGSPSPEDILFQVSVHLVSHVAETELAPGSQTNSKADVKGPYHRYAVDFAALPDAFTFTLQPDGRRKASIVFMTYVFAPDGTLLSSLAKSMNLDLPPALYKEVMNTGLGMRLEVSAPVHGESFLRMGIKDVPSNKFGVVEIGTRSVDKLPLLSAQQKAK